MLKEKISLVFDIILDYQWQSHVFDKNLKKKLLFSKLFWSTNDQSHH